MKTPQINSVIWSENIREKKMKKMITIDELSLKMN